MSLCLIRDKPIEYEVNRRSAGKMFGSKDNGCTPNNDGCRTHAFNYIKIPNDNIELIV